MRVLYGDVWPARVLTSALVTGGDVAVMVAVVMAVDLDGAFMALVEWVMPVLDGCFYFDATSDDDGFSLVLAERVGYANLELVDSFFLLRLVERLPCVVVRLRFTRKDSL